MIKPRLSRVSAIAIATACLACGLVSTANAQYQSPSNAPVKIDRTTASVDLITKTSRLLEFEYDVPELVIDNQSVIRATPIASNKILITALKPGFAVITASDPQERKQSINIQVRGDVRALESALRQFFPNSNIRATALDSGVVLTGTLANGKDSEGVNAVALEYFPQVYNNIKLPDSQMIAIEVQVYEVARTKVRELGMDWQLLTSDFNLNVSGAGNPANNLSFSVVENGDTFNGFLQALERQSLARLMDKPVLVTTNGRPAEFLQGGEVPFEINQGLGNVTIEFRPFGTKLDVVPIVRGEGTIRLEVRAEVSEPDQALATNSGVPGFRVRRVNTGVDMKVGHTLALAGDIREEVESEVSGIPHLMNLPLVGRAFSRVQETRQEVELVMLLTPRFIGEVDPSLMPAGGPGRNTVSPSDSELYRNGLIEVPRCGPDCGTSSNQPMDPVRGSFGGQSIHQQMAPRTIPGNVVPPTQAPAVPPEYPSNLDWSAPPATPAPQNQSRSGFGYPSLDQPGVRTGNAAGNGQRNKFKKR